MKLIYTALLLALPSFGTVAVDNYKDAGYQGAGTHTTSIIANGANLGCMVSVWYRSGTISSVICGGNSMTRIQTVAACGATVDTWLYFGEGLNAGPVAVSLNATVESQYSVITFNGANQKGQPDATTGVIAGTAGSDGAPLPITTAANNALVIGTFCLGANSTSATSNGTWIGRDTVSLKYWRSISDVTPAGDFTLQGAGGDSSALGYGYQAFGLSIAPLASNTAANPSITPIAVGP
jgi:hypothetical protein